jgi:hypothetical protein
LKSTIGGSGRRTMGRRMAVIIEDQQEETETPKVKLLRDRVPFSARGTLPPQRVSPDPNGPRARQLKIQQKRDEVAWLRVLRDQVQLGELEVRYQADRDRKKPTSKPRSWRPKTKERDKRQNARGLRRGRLRRRRRRVSLDEDRRTEGKHLDGSRWP